MALKKPQKSLKKWSDQKWRTASGKPSIQGKDAKNERYLPEKAIKALKKTAKGRKQLADSNRKKRADTKAGKQRSKQPPKVAARTAKYRKGKA